MKTITMKDKEVGFVYTLDVSDETYEKVDKLLMKEVETTRKDIASEGVF